MDFLPMLIGFLPLVTLITVAILWEKYGENIRQRLNEVDWDKLRTAALYVTGFIVFALVFGGGGDGYDDGVYRSMRGR